MKILINVLCLMQLLLCVSGTAQTTYYVNQVAAGTNDGSSWTNAFTDLQAAIDTAAENDVIWVAAGMYLPQQIPNGSSSGVTNRNNAYHLDKDLQIYGGFVGTETQLSERDILLNETILSGDFNDDDVVIGNDSTLSISMNTENAYHVIITANLTSAAIIDGFSINGGNANGTVAIDYNGITFYRNNGGGMYNYYSFPTLTNVTFSGNAAYYVGGMYNYYSSLTLTNATFSENFGYYGGGMYNNFSSPTLTNVIFSGNYADYGGGMYNHYSHPRLTNVTFSGNYADYGGGMYNLYRSPILINVVFSGNYADNGGGMYNFGSSPTLTNVTFSGNSASDNGGGMYNFSSYIILYNTVFYNNTALTGMDIGGNNIDANSSHNASDGTGGNISLGTGFVVLSADPFTNVANPIGADSIWHTADDGFVMSIGSALLAAGTATAPNVPTMDITGQTIIGTPSIGAYSFESLLSVNGVNLEDNILVYPNPLYDILNIENGVGQARLFNNLGQLLQTFRITNNKQSINLSELPNGFYHLQIINDNGQVIVKELVK